MKINTAKKTQKGEFVCVHCKMKKEYNEVAIDKHDSREKLCKSCYRDGIRYCRVCGKFERVGTELFIDREYGDFICKSCAQSAGKIFCKECGRFHDVSSLKEVKNGDVVIFSGCFDCYTNKYAKCTSCGRIEQKNSMVRFDGGYYCRNCEENHLFYCQRCENYCYLDDSVEIDGEYFCPSCASEIEESDTIGIKEYNYVPSFSLHKTSAETTNPLYMGFELEVEVARGKKSKIVKSILKFQKENNIENHLYFKRDGSLHNGFEVVSQPMTLRYIKQNLKLRDLLKLLTNEGATSYAKGTCGLHVHLSRDYFTTDEVDKIRLFINKNYKEIYSFSKRDGHGDRFIMNENYHLGHFKNSVSQSGRYWAFNLNTNKNTVEVRIFRGTLSFSRVMASLEFCEAISLYSKAVGFMNTGKSNSWRDFIEWCRKTNRFKFFLKTAGLLKSIKEEREL